ncbi:MAG: hypothetical protein QW315_06520 [Candidatus Hadarchaeum sp.]
MSPVKKEDVYGLFLQEKPKEIIIYLKKENKPLYTSIISKKVDSTYAHTFNIISELEKLKLVSFKESGRIKLVKLTELGEEVAKTIINLLDLLKLAELEKELFKIYDKEIKGKLREQMNKESINRQLNKLKDEINTSFKESPENISILAKKLLKKIDGILAEVFGYIPG